MLRMQTIIKLPHVCSAACCKPSHWTVPGTTLEAAKECMHDPQAERLFNRPYLIQLEEVTHDVRQFEASKVIYLDLHIRKMSQQPKHSLQVHCTADSSSHSHNKGGAVPA
jgi:hypothetical protein